MQSGVVCYMFYNAMKQSNPISNVLCRFYSMHYLRVSKMHPGLNTKHNEPGSEKMMTLHHLTKTLSSGLFCMYPLLTRALEKLDRIIDDEMQNIGARKITTPYLVLKSQWEKTGNGEDTKLDFQLQTRQNQNYILSSKQEAGVMSMLVDGVPLSYKRLPVKYYQIGRKFKDVSYVEEQILTTREYEVVDLYAFDLSLEEAKRTYREVSEIYSKLFSMLGLKTSKVSSTRAVRDDVMSHQYLVTPSHNTNIHRCQRCGAYFTDRNQVQTAPSYCSNEQCPKELTICDGIEVARTTYLGTECSQIMKAQAVNKDGIPQSIHVVHSIIGTTHLLEAALESLSAGDDLHWPQLVAPHQICVIPEHSSKNLLALSDDLHRDLLALPNLRDEVLYHDVQVLSASEKISAARSYGIPYLVVIRDNIDEDSRYNLIDVYGGSTEHYTKDQLMATLSQIPTVLL